MKQEFVIWAKKYMSYNEQGHPTGITLPWELKPEYVIQPLDTYTAQQPHLFGLLTSGKSHISYTLKNQKILFGSHQLAHVKTMIAKNFDAIKTEIEQSNELIAYKNNIKNIYDSMIEELDIIFSLPDKLQLLPISNQHYKNKQEIRTYIQNYLTDLARNSFINMQENKPQGNGYIIVCIINVINNIY